MDFATQRRITAALKECGIPHSLINVAMTQEEICVKTPNTQAVVALSELMDISINAVDSEGKFFVIKSGTTEQYESYQKYCETILPDVVTRQTKRQGETHLDACIELDMTFFQVRKVWSFTPFHRGLRVSMKDNFVTIDRDGLGTVPVYGRKPQISEGLSSEELAELQDLGIVKVDLQKFGGHKFWVSTEPTPELAAGILESITFRFWRGEDSLFGDIISPDGGVYYFGRGDKGVYLKKSSKAPDMDLGEWLDH